MKFPTKSEFTGYFTSEEDVFFESIEKTYLSYLKKNGDEQVETEEQLKELMKQHFDELFSNLSIRLVGPVNWVVLDHYELSEILIKIYNNIKLFADRAKIPVNGVSVRGVRNRLKSIYYSLLQGPVLDEEEAAGSFNSDNALADWNSRPGMLG